MRSVPVAAARSVSIRSNLCSTVIFRQLYLITTEYNSRVIQQSVAPARDALPPGPCSDRRKGIAAPAEIALGSALPAGEAVFDEQADRFQLGCRGNVILDAQ